MLNWDQQRWVTAFPPSAGVSVPLKGEPMARIHKYLHHCHGLLIVGRTVAQRLQILVAAAGRVEVAGVGSVPSAVFEEAPPALGFL